METHIYDTIQQFLDGLLPASEEAHVRHLIATDKTWMNAHQEMMQLNEMLQDDNQLMEPSMRFTQNVMDDIKALPVARPASAYVSGVFFKTIMAVLGCGLGILVIYMFSTMEFISPASGQSGAFPSVKTPEVNWSFLSNTHMLIVVAMVNIIGLLVLGDTILTRRKKKLMQQL